MNFAKLFTLKRRWYIGWWRARRTVYRVSAVSEVCALHFWRLKGVRTKCIQGGELDKWFLRHTVQLHDKFSCAPKPVTVKIYYIVRWNENMAPNSAVRKMATESFSDVNCAWFSTARPTNISRMWYRSQTAFAQKKIRLLSLSSCIKTVGVKQDL